MASVILASNTFFFADDLTVAADDNAAGDVTKPAQAALNIVEAWARRSFMQVNAKKTVHMVFTKARAGSPSPA